MEGIFRQTFPLSPTIRDSSLVLSRVSFEKKDAMRPISVHATIVCALLVTCGCGSERPAGNPEPGLAAGEPAGQLP